MLDCSICFSDISILVTGAAGGIGSDLVAPFKDWVIGIGIDIFNEYYDVELKNWHLRIIEIALKNIKGK